MSLLFQINSVLLSFLFIIFLNDHVTLKYDAENSALPSQE